MFIGGVAMLGALLVAVAPGWAADFRDAFPQIYTMSSGGVNTQTGIFHLSEKDFSIGPLTVDRSYSSNGDNTVYVFPTDPVSSGNTARTQNMAMKAPGNVIAHSLRGFMQNGTAQQSNGGTMPVMWVRLGDQDIQFSILSNGKYMPWNGGAIGWSLIGTATAATLTNKGGDVYSFTSGRLMSVVYANGHRLDYSYGTYYELRTVISSMGYALVFDYNNSAKTVVACGYNTTQTYVSSASTCASAPIRFTYGFSPTSSSYQLATVTDNEGHVTNFSYSGRFLTCISLVDSSTCRLTNEYGPEPPSNDATIYKADMVRRQTAINGAIWTYYYDNAAYVDAGQQIPGQDRYSSSEISGNTEGALIEYTNGVVKHSMDPTGEHWYTFNATDLSDVEFAEHNKVHMDYDENHNATLLTRIPKPNSGLSNTTVSQVFPQQYAYANYGNGPLCVASAPLCDKPTSRTDERSNVTTYTYDASHGGVLTETGPAVNGVQPQTRYTYAQRTAWVKNAGGGYSAASPVWVLTQTSSCRTGAASGAGCAVASDEIRTTYDYGPDSGPNNLTLRGVVADAAGTPARTCYAYDWQGNKISETRPRAGLTSCP